MRKLIREEGRREGLLELCFSFLLVKTKGKERGVGFKNAEEREEEDEGLILRERR